MNNAIAIIICTLLGVIIGILFTGTTIITKLLEEIKGALKK